MLGVQGLYSNTTFPNDLILGNKREHVPQLDSTRELWAVGTVRPTAGRHLGAMAELGRLGRPGTPAAALACMVLLVAEGTVPKATWSPRESGEGELGCWVSHFSLLHPQLHPGWSAHSPSTAKPP